MNWLFLIHRIVRVGRDTAFEKEHQKSHSLSNSNGSPIIKLTEIATCDFRQFVVVRGLSYIKLLSILENDKGKMSTWGSAFCL